MASTSSINSNSSGSQAPNPPPRTYSRPIQPPPPPPLPSVPPVPPTRDSSIAISKTVINKNSPIPPNKSNLHANAATINSSIATKPNQLIETGFLSQFEPLFKPLSDLPPPDPFMNKPKSYPSQRAQQKQPLAPGAQA